MMFLLYPFSVLWAQPEYFIMKANELEHYEDYMETARAMSTLDATSIHILLEYPGGRLLPAEQVLPLPTPPPNKGEVAPSIGVDMPGASTSALAGKAVYISQCHGWIWNSNLDRFATQRGNVHDTVEDFHNPEGANQYLVHYLENAGAMVFTAKERDLNSNMAIADNDGEGYAEEGSGFVDGPLGFSDNGPWLYGENPFDAGTTRRFPAANGAVAQWIPEVPQDGLYAVYVSWDSDSSNASNAHYRITHKGGVIDRYFDQRVHGSTWQYVEQLWLQKGVNSLTVELIADSDETSAWLSADAVRIGGGMGDVMRQGETTGRPRWESGAIMYTQFNGAPTAVYDPGGDGFSGDGGSDPSSRSRWAAWEHPAGEDAVYLSWHSNAFDGSVQGTSTYVWGSDWGAPEGDYSTGSGDFARAVHGQMIDAFQVLWDSDWQDRGIRTANFSETHPNNNDEMPAALIELAFHDNELDAAILLEPEFRQDASRAMYRGIVEYFATKDGYNPVYLPEPPRGVECINRSSGIQVQWEEGLSGEPFGDPAMSFQVFQSKDGFSWDNGTEVMELQTIIEIPEQEVRYIRIAAKNEGGISFPSETIACRKGEIQQAPILIVSAFDRLQASTLFWEDIPTLGAVKRMNLQLINAYNSSVVYANSLHELGWDFDMVSDEKIGQVDLTKYALIVWILGEESTFDRTFIAEEQTLVRDYWEQGGKLIVSGSEIFWDLDYAGNTADRDFAEQVLGALMEDDDAETYMVEGESLLAGISLSFAVEDGALYHVEYPDVLSSERQVIATYDNGGTAAVLGDGVATFGFPLETIAGANNHRLVMERLLLELLADYQPEEDDATDTSHDETDGSVNVIPGVGDYPEYEKIPVEDVSAGGCGCSATSTKASWAGLLLMAIFGYIRRYAIDER